MSQHPISEHSRLLQKFDTCRTAFMLCDVQEKVEPHIRNFHDAVHAANAMAAIHTLLSPQFSVFVATEQYPKGIGHVYHDIKLPADAIVADKLTPSMLVPAIRPHILGDPEKGILPVQQVIIWGHETYGCVLQTTDELLTHGIRVAVLVDGCGSQVQKQHDAAIMQMSHWEGVMMTTVPSALMQLTRSDSRFVKDVIRILKQYGADWASTQLKLELKAKGEGVAPEMKKTALEGGKEETAWSGMEK
ncbi:Isochorismatase family [Lotmaria passim]